MPVTTPMILPLQKAAHHPGPEASLELAGGKGRALARMVSAGLPVPEGFVITTQGYTAFLQANDLQGRIRELQAQRQAEPRRVARTILAMFEEATLPSALRTGIIKASASWLPDTPLAVRSSATAEDLAGASFAGQQATFLNVRGERALLTSVIRCWASLYSERALSYRTRLNWPGERLGIAVIVQRLLEADVSGVLFTANPVSGDRQEMVINASFGLGEAIVSGEVTPDTYIVRHPDSAQDRPTVKAMTIGSKELRVVSGSDQGTITQPVASHERGRRVLEAPELETLARLCLRTEALFDAEPQDIEWLIADGRIYLLQSRPITRLPSAPPAEVTWEPPAGTAKLVRRQVVENMPEPLSPLFEALYLGEGLDLGIDRLVADMGLPIDLDQFIERPMFVTVNGYGYCRYDIRFGWPMLGLIPKMLYFYVFKLPGLINSLLPRWQDQGLPEYLELIRQWQAVDPAIADDETLFAGIRALALGDARYWFQITMMVGAAKITEAMLDRFLTSRLIAGSFSSARFLRGSPSKTLTALQTIESIAAEVRRSAELTELVRVTPAPALLAVIGDHTDGREIAARLRDFLKTYGHQVFNLDFAEPTQRENPELILANLKAEIERPRPATEQRLAELAHERSALTDQTARALGPLRRRLFLKLLSWAQKFGPYREDALFYMGAAWPTLRQLALRLGERYSARGILSDAGQIFYLIPAEIQSVISDPHQRTQAPGVSRADVSALASLAQSRQELREARKRLHPPGRVPADLRFKWGPFDLTRFFETWETQKRNPAGASDTLSGFAVSPGRVSGPACVILSPADFNRMRPDSILVCPTTTPAWTPLFARASALVTDIGAMLAHGSIVAREYGIPAVLGTGNATQQIEDGQWITVDGDAGVVLLNGSAGADL